MEDDRGMTLHHFLNGKTVWQNGQLDAHTLMHRYSSVDRKTAVAKEGVFSYCFPSVPERAPQRAHTHTQTRMRYVLYIVCVRACTLTTVNSCATSTSNKCKRWAVGNWVKGERLVCVVRACVYMFGLFGGGLFLREHCNWKSTGGCGCSLEDNWVIQGLNFIPCAFYTGSICAAVAFVLRQVLKLNQSPHFLARGQCGTRGEERSSERMSWKVHRKNTETIFCVKKSRRCLQQVV